MPAFARTIGIDYSGAETPTASLKGLRVYLAKAGDASIGFGRPPLLVPDAAPTIPSGNGEKIV